MNRVAFISGHRDITLDEFNEHYAPLILKAHEEGDSFVVGDYYGVDFLAQKYLYFIGATNVTVYHMCESPRNIVTELNAHLMGGYYSDEDRDSAMTIHSDYDIAWVRKGKENSGTQQNINRREYIRPNEDGDLNELKEFIDACSFGAFIDYDGFGNFATKDKTYSKIEVHPSKINNKSLKVPTWATHINWYNR